MANPFAAQLADALENSWPAIARPNQLPPPGDWQIWLLLAGRGFGKTRTLAEWVCQQTASGQAGRIALVTATAADARDVLVEGKTNRVAFEIRMNLSAASSLNKIIIPQNFSAVMTVFDLDAPALEFRSRSEFSGATKPNSSTPHASTSATIGRVSCV
jgi:phage terminase large subunit-like protein